MIRRYFIIGGILLLISFVETGSLAQVNSITKEAKTSPQTSVVGRHAEVVFGNPKMDILDYAFVENQLALLTVSGKHAFLRILSLEYRAINSAPLPDRPMELFKDCFGNTHIIFTDSVVQILIKGDTLVLYRGVTRERFKLLLENCEAQSGSHLFFSEYKNFNQTVAYFKSDKKSGNKELMREISDPYFYSQARSLQWEIKRLTTGGYNEVSYPAEDADRFENKSRRRANLDLIAKNPVYAPLFRVEDEIYIFDHYKDSCYVYNSDGLLKRVFPISYQHEKGWNKELITDESNKRVYVVLLRSGVATLCLINNTTGEVTYRIPVLGVTYPEKIKVKNNSIYYLASVGVAHANKKQLYKYYQK